MGRYAFTKEERETVIRWSEADQKVEIFTASRPVANRLRKIKEAVLKNTSKGEAGEWFGEFWETPRFCVVFRTKRKGSTLTPERAAAMRRLRDTGTESPKDEVVELVRDRIASLGEAPGISLEEVVRKEGLKWRI